MAPSKTKDYMVLILLITNIITLFLAFNQNWSMFEVIFIYYTQFVGLLITSIIRIKTPKYKLFGFLLFSCISLFYFNIISITGIFDIILKSSIITIGLLLLPILIFTAINISKLFVSKKQSDILAFWPLIMVFPMHLGLAITQFVSYDPKYNLPVLLIFCGIKTFFEMFMYVEENNFLKRREKLAKERNEANDKNFIREI